MYIHVSSAKSAESVMKEVFHCPMLSVKLTRLPVIYTEYATTAANASKP